MTGPSGAREASLGRLAPPPREVPATTRAWVGLGADDGVAWWFFVGAASLVFWIFCANADLSFLTFRGEIARAPGIVTATRDTGATEGGRRRHPGTPIFANDFEFRSADGVARRGVSWCRGDRVHAGQKVTIEYLAANPAASRIEGSRRGLRDESYLFFVLAPVGALAVLGSRLRRGWRAVHLLEHGAYALASLRSKEVARVQKRRTVYRLTFDFTAAVGGCYEIVEVTDTPGKLEDERRELALYEPTNPRRAILVDNVPGHPEIDRDTGEVRAKAMSEALAIATLAGLVVGGNLIWAAMRALG